MTSSKSIVIQGARTHNLKNVNLSLPRDQFIVLTGLSGSGKSSLAFDTLYAEGQRRYVESLSAYARQFLSLMEKPDVDHIEGLSPAISIEQKSTSHNPRSTVGTITEIYDYLRLLYARIGVPHCPEHGQPLKAQTISQMVDHILKIPQDTKIMILSPVVDDRKGEYSGLFDNLKKQGYTKARVNGEMIELETPPVLERYKKHSIDVVIDRIKVSEEHTSRLAESIETALLLSGGIVKVALMDESEKTLHTFSENYACHVCGFQTETLEPKHFSFNSPKGACETCDGLGLVMAFDEKLIITDPELTLAQGAIKNWSKNNRFYYQQLEDLSEHYGFSLEKPFQSLAPRIKDILLHGSGDEKILMSQIIQGSKPVQKLKVFEGVIPHYQRRYTDVDSNIIKEELSKMMKSEACFSCGGSRLNKTAQNVLIAGTSILMVTQLSIEDALLYFQKLKLDGQDALIAEKILKEIVARLQFLVNVGLNYLTLNRRADTLSGGEAQRIRLASQIGSGLVGVMYILDEPSIGLHQRDNDRLLETLRYLKKLGNTVIVVEHDWDAIKAADYVVDIGPGAGKLGGEIVAQGTLQNLMDTPASITGQYFSGKLKIEIPKKHAPQKDWIRINKACGNNLKNVSTRIPVGLLTCVTGVSGSGKSTLINHTLYPVAAEVLNGATTLNPMEHESIAGLGFFDKVIDIDQSPIGRTPRSNPSTYTGLFTLIRDLFTQTQEAKTRGYTAGRFSFNVKGGRCEACEGDGVIKVEMHFLADVYVTCDECQGRRYNRETLGVHFKGKSIADVLDMSVAEACEFFDAIPAIKKRLDILMEVGLSYIQLGQRATTLSGGEAQRIKLAKELSKRDTGQTLYILDEPTTGLHFHDINQLLKVLHTLRDRGNTIVIIEHNLDVIKTADWIIDLGPEGGNLGGEIIAEGPVEAIVAEPRSYTGRYLKPYLEG